MVPRHSAMMHLNLFVYKKHNNKWILIHSHTKIGSCALVSTTTHNKLYRHSKYLLLNMIRKHIICQVGIIADKEHFTSHSIWQLLLVDPYRVIWMSHGSKYFKHLIFVCFTSTKSNTQTYLSKRSAIFKPKDGINIDHPQLGVMCYHNHKKQHQKKKKKKHKWIQVSFCYLTYFVLHTTINMDGVCIML